MNKRKCIHSPGAHSSPREYYVTDTGGMHTDDLPLIGTVLFATDCVIRAEHISRCAAEAQEISRNEPNTTLIAAQRRCGLDRSLEEYDGTFP